MRENRIQDSLPGEQQTRPVAAQHQGTIGNSDMNKNTSMQLNGIRILQLLAMTAGIIFSACSGLSTADLGNGAFLPALEIDSVQPLSPQSLQVVFNASLDSKGIQDNENYSITADNEEVDVLNIQILPNSNNRIITLTTTEQVPKTAYTLKITDLVSSNGLKPPQGGALYSFQGYAAQSNSPNLIISQGGIPYASGGIFRFPDSGVGSEQATLTFLLENNGEKDLLLFGAPVSAAGGQSELFAITQPGSSAVAAGNSLEFSVTFTPQNTGSNTTTLFVESTDPDESTYQLSLAAVVSDTTAPDTGSESLTFDSVNKTTIQVSWPAASDNDTAASLLQYRLYYTTSSAMDSVGAVEGLGVAVMEYTSNTTSAAVSGLSPDRLYHFNVLVRDTAGNTGSYASSSVTTRAEAELAAEIRTGINGSDPAELYVWNDKLYFRADDGSNGVELYEMEPEEVPVLFDIHGSGSSTPQYFQGYNGKLYFSADDGNDGRELWEYDGTNAPQITYDLNSGSGSATPRQLITFKGSLIFGSGNSLYEYTGSGAPGAVSDSNYRYYSNSEMAAINGKLLYMGNFDITTSALGIQDYLSIWDGVSTPGYFPDFPSSGSPMSPYPVIELIAPTVFDNKIYFASDNDANDFYFLWEYDSIAATPPVKKYFDNVTDIEAFNGKLYFVGNDGGHSTNNLELRVYDGSSASLVAEINPSGSAKVQNLTVSNGKLYFSADDGSHGQELWVYDGVNPPSMVLDINDGSDSNPSHLVDYNGVLYFQANDGIHGTEVWKLNP
jgi:ELWxxDGT repeat protein